MRLALPLAVAPVAALPDPADPAWRRWLTVPELAYCAGLERTGEHLVARVLGRRVVARALGWADEPPWQDIEIRREPSGRPTVVLRGDLAGRAGGPRRLPVPGLSLSHAGGYAAALGWLPPRPGDRR